MDLVKRLLEISNELHNGIGQAYLALSELDKADGRGNIGVYRLREAAKMFDWCADQIRILADKAEAREGYRS